MHQMREDLDIIFRKTLPENILRTLQLCDDCSVLKYVESDYRSIAYGVCPEYSENELACRYDAIKGQSRENGIFSLLYQYAEKVLNMQNGKLTVKLDQILGWNSISKRLGQDIFTTAWMAYRDCDEEGMRGQHQFVWSSVLATDDVKLNNVLRKGTAENHFHLHGSTQSFALSWVSIMNHPREINESIDHQGRFRLNRDMRISRGVEDNVMTWKERVTYAAMIRALLFGRMISERDPGGYADVRKKFEKFRRLPMQGQVDRLVMPLRRLYGEVFEQPDRANKCLDYVISREWYDVKKEADNRLLSGERAFLYNCFLRIYQKTNPNRFSLYEQRMFYLYLLIKHQFRSELIQINKGVGFYNFSEYQNRKNQFFEKYNEYNVEAQRLAVIAEQNENYIKSFETRVMVGQSKQEFQAYINELDAQINFSNGRRQLGNYYVLHFPKKAFQRSEFTERHRLVSCPRNVITRKRAERGARSLRKYILWEQGKKQRVYGIDACSNEIGCRPETFATEFRYLRGISEHRYRIPWYQSAVERYEELGITYHAGEDFLDITDGIRAIDEAINFLDLRKNDRLGHAIALGIDPEEYYLEKHSAIYQPLQDRLDDLVWLLYRSMEWNVSISEDHREEMKYEARMLIGDLYRNQKDRISNKLHGDILDAYYASWHLRGDHPLLYASGRFCEIKKMTLDPYEKYMTGNSRKERLEKLRDDQLITQLYYWYHYDAEVKKQALKTVHFSVEKWYVELVGRMQKALRGQIAKKGIAIECNPTSNYLISNFRYFSKHPVLVFNHYHLSDKDDEPNLWVSINTDDIGVFDTSLSHEYALLFSAIIRKRHLEGNWNDDAVYEYLDALRQNGLDMAFKDQTER